MTNLQGKVLGQFEIMEEIGRGGMASVYRARQLTMNRIVAVKVLPQHLLHDPGFYERFEREVDVISHLEHPHILPIYDYGQTDNVPFIAMRYLGGGSLDQRIRRGPMSLSELEQPLRQIAQALDYAHRQGIIHRDLKPGNIMLDENGNAYLSDFGIARVLGSNLTGSMIVGTPAYMSPEQANGMPIDGRSDIYALGVVMFEMITGRAPYQAETPMAILLKHINEPMPPVSEFRPDVPQSVEDVIAKATAKDPDKRYSSASAMIDDLSVALREPVGTPRPKPAQPLNSTMATAIEMPAIPSAIPAPGTGTAAGVGTGTQPAGEPQRRSLPLVAVLVLLLVILAGGAGALFLVSTTNGVDAIPTPFPRASTVNHTSYSISMPEQWMPLGAQFADVSDSYRQAHMWQNDDEAFVTLSLVVAEPDFAAQIQSYDEGYYARQSLQLIDEATAEDGTLRRSYRMENHAEFLPGQLDVFYMRRGPYFVVLETYTSDESGNRFVGSLQLILDSLRVTS